MPNSEYLRYRERQLQYAKENATKRREASRKWRIKRKEEAARALQPKVVAFDPTAPPNEPPEGLSDAALALWYKEADKARPKENRGAWE